MADKGEKWSVNSGKWAYSRASPLQVEPAARKGSGKIASIAFLVLFAGVGLAGSVWLGFVRLPNVSIDASPPTSVSSSEPHAGSDNQEHPHPETASPSPDTTSIQEENSKLKLQLEEEQKTVDEKQLVIDRQSMELQGRRNPTMPPEYSIIKTTTTTRNLVIYADHQFVAGQDHWVRASCYASPVVNGVRYWIELASREQPDFSPKARLATPETLNGAGFTWPDVFSLASNCPWMDDAHYSAEQLGSAALTERKDSSLPTPVPVTVPPLPAPSAAQQEPSRGSRQVFPARDLVGSDITRLSGNSQTECEALCINNDTCKGYTYDNWNRMCITKNGVSNFRIEPRSTAVIFSGQVPSLSTAAVVMVKRRDREFRDASYASKLTSDYDSCANSCLRDDRCVGVNFNQSSGSCQFFAAPSEYVPVSGIMLGYKYQPAN